MKYSDQNPPLQCMMTQSTCYKGTCKFTPKGVLWHSTGCNNNSVSRYVQPDDNAPNRNELLQIIGKNPYGNDWNHTYVQAGLNFWIGKLADGTVAAVQTMPFDYRPWGCGYGSRGSCNDTHIQFEICEDGLNNRDYFMACYKEACEMTAYLCKKYNIDPTGTTVCDGVTVPTIIDHVGSSQYGLGSDHGDIQHWSTKYGITMNNVRNDVAALMNEPSPEPTPEKPVNIPTKQPWEYNITYRTHTHEYGWFDWVGDGEISGTKGLSLAIDAIQIEGGMNSGILPTYQLNIDINGETGVCKFGEVCGAEDKGRNAYAIKINCEKKMKYRVYRQKKGWSKWAKNNQWTEGADEKLRIEAIQIQLA